MILDGAVVRLVAIRCLVESILVRGLAMRDCVVHVKLRSKLDAIAVKSTQL